jgi:CBS domain-containing protein
MQAQDIMARNPVSVTPDMPVREAARLMKSEDIGVVPVVEDNASRRVVGLLTDRDIAVRVVAEGRDATTPVREAMSGSPKTVRDNATVDDVMRLMGAEKVRRVPVVDERGALVGLVSQADVILEGRNRGRAEETLEAISTPGGKHTQS